MFSKWLGRKKPRITETHAQDAGTNSDEASADPTLKIPSFADLYHLREYIGRGTCGSVRSCVSVLTGQECAVKLVERSMDRTFKEIEMYKSCGQHEHVIRLLETFEDVTHYYLVLEKMHGASLFDQICRRGWLSECQTAQVCKDVASGLHFLHTEKGIIHRDIKPGNLLCVNPHKVSPVKICDFDVAFKLDDDMAPPPSQIQLWSPVGSPAYMAPEVVETVYESSTSYNEKCDVWSLGGTLITCLTGALPFNGECMQPNCPQKVAGMDCFWCRETMFGNIQWGSVDFGMFGLNDRSQSCLHMLENLMSKNANSRYSALEILSDPWVKISVGFEEEHEYEDESKDTPDQAFVGQNEFLPEGQKYIEKVGRPEYMKAYSRKVFVGGLPQDMLQEELCSIFSNFGILNVEWPRRTQNVYFVPKGYAFIIFEKDVAIQNLLGYCLQIDGKYYLNIHAGLDEKLLEIRPWLYVNSNITVGPYITCDPRKTVFVGRVSTLMTAGELFQVMERLFNCVCYVEISTDGYGYPKGAARVSFSNQQSFIAACKAGYSMLDFNRRIEIKPYVMNDQNCEECSNQYANIFCPHASCLQYYCNWCWGVMHGGQEYDHKPMIIANVCGNECIVAAAP